MEGPDETPDHLPALSTFRDLCLTRTNRDLIQVVEV